MDSIMSMIEEKLNSLGLKLPTLPAAAGNYLPFRRSGNLLFLSGAISMDQNGALITGKVGSGHATLEEGYEAARRCLLTLLAVIKSAVGDLDKVKQVVVLNGFVNTLPDFTDIPLVINGASDLLGELYGDAGKHSRAAVGVASLPKGVLVEVQLTVEVS